MSDPSAGVVVAAIAADLGAVEEIDDLAVDGADDGLPRASQIDRGRIIRSILMLDAERTAGHAAAATDVREDVRQLQSPCLGIA